MPLSSGFFRLISGIYRQKLVFVCQLALFCCFSAVQANTPPREDRDPEATINIVNKTSVQAEHFMVAAANPYAVEAGYQVLKAGGCAADAAIAIQATLTLVEPQSSGIGGGVFMLHYDAKQQQLITLDGREAAPLAATPQLFFDAKTHKPVTWRDAVVGGRSVGTPGAVKALEAAHQRYGCKPWADNWQYAIDLAERGFVVSERLARSLALRLNPGLEQLPAAAQYFWPNGQPLAKGMVKKNPQLAAVLKKIATQGSKGFYEGTVAEQLVVDVQHSKLNPGLLAKVDLAQYQAKWREPVCIQYHQNKVCGMAPPSSGGTAVLQIIKQLEAVPLHTFAADSIEFAHYFSQSSRLAFADRDKYSADPDFVKIPTQAMLDDAYLAKRAALINPKRDMGKAEAGPLGELGKDDAIERPSTSHLAIVDQYGNAISMTTSVENAFGSAVFSQGFLLNNQLTDFSLNPEQNGLPVANRVEPGKRPRSSMSPTMVFDEQGRIKLLIGSPGGSHIINYVAQSLLYYLDLKLPLAQALAFGHISNRNNFTAIERSSELQKLVEPLQQLGHQVQLVDLNSGLHAIAVEHGKLVGAADPRREGVAKGD